MDYPLRERFRLNAIAVAHAVTYALSVAVVALLASFVVGAAAGGGAVHAKIFLFVVGWLMMGYAIVSLWPSNSTKLRTESLKDGGGTLKTSEPSSDSSPDSISEDETETRFQEAVYRLPPGRWLPRPTPSHRVGMEGKIFLGSVFVLLTSFVMEVVFGVGAA